MRDFEKVKLSEEECTAVDKMVIDDVRTSRDSNITVLPIYVKRETVDGKKVMQETVTSQIEDGRVIEDGNKESLIKVTIQ